MLSAIKQKQERLITRGSILATLLIFPLTAVSLQAPDRFTYSSDGAIVLDSHTELQWMRCSVGQEWNLAADRCDGTASGHTWREAKQLTSSLGGHSDWRLPTREELNTLVICSSGQREGFATEGIFAGNGGRCQGNFSKPTIHPFAFPDTPHKEAFWTSDKLENAPVRHAWVVGFGSGYVNDIARGQPRPHVRLVRD